MRRILSSFVFTLALLCPWIAHAQLQVPPPSRCSVTAQNIFVRDQMNLAYYWNEFLPSGLNVASFGSPEEYLEAVRYRPIDNAYSYITSAAANDAFYNDSQVIKYGFTQNVGPANIRVLEVWAGSGAEEAGLQRGDLITHVNGQNVRTLVESNGLSAAFGPDTPGQSVSITTEKPSGEILERTMTKRLVTIPTVSLTHVVDVNGRKVGYLFFRNFVRPSSAALNEAFAALKAAGATELVLDLRYNGGGLVDVAVHLASLIGGARVSGQVMIKWTHNNRVGPFADRVTRFNETPEQTLNLQRLVVITTGGSASASELIINSLRPYIPVTVIGDATYGKPVGQYSFNFCDKVLVPVAFALRNANDEGDFFDGIPADCGAPDDITHQLGDPAESSYAEALTFLRTGACTPRSEGVARALRALREGAPRQTGWAALINAQ